MSDLISSPPAASSQIQVLDHHREPNAAQWRFIAAFIKTENATEAYHLAGYKCKTRKGAASAASIMLRKPHIRYQVDKHREQAIKASLVSIASLSQEYEEARGLAMDVESPGAAVSATTGKAKLHGLLVDRSETKTELSVSFEGASEFLLNALGQRAIQGAGGKNDAEK